MGWEQSFWRLPGWGVREGRQAGTRFPGRSLQSEMEHVFKVTVAGWCDAGLLNLLLFKVKLFPETREEPEQQVKFKWQYWRVGCRNCAQATCWVSCYFSLRKCMLYNWGKPWLITSMFYVVFLFFISPPINNCIAHFISEKSHCVQSSQTIHTNLPAFLKCHCWGSGKLKLTLTLSERE